MPFSKKEQDNPKNWIGKWSFIYATKGKMLLDILSLRINGNDIQGGYGGPLGFVVHFLELFLCNYL